MHGQNRSYPSILVVSILGDGGSALAGGAESDRPAFEAPPPLPKDRNFAVDIGADIIGGVAGIEHRHGAGVGPPFGLFHRLGNPMERPSLVRDLRAIDRDIGREAAEDLEIQGDRDDGLLQPGCDRDRRTRSGLRAA